MKKDFRPYFPYLFQVVTQNTLILFRPILCWS